MVDLIDAHPLCKTVNPPIHIGNDSYFNSLLPWLQNSAASYISIYIDALLSDQYKFRFGFPANIWK